MTGKELKIAISLTGLKLTVFAKKCDLDRRSLYYHFASEKVDASFISKINRVTLEYGVDLFTLGLIESRPSAGPSLSLLKQMNISLTKEVELLKELNQEISASRDALITERDFYKKIVERGINNFTLKSFVPKPQRSES